MTTTHTTRRQIIEAANARGISLRVSGKDYPAQLTGTHLDFPYIRTIGQCFHGVDLQAQINWHQAQKLADGSITRILFN